MTEATNTTRWDVLARWSPTAFLVAGVLLSFTAAVYGLELVASMSLEGLLTGLPLFVGLLVAYVGLLGLYPRLANRVPRLALAGIVLIVVPVIVVVFFLVFSLASLLVEFGEPSFTGTLFMVIFVGFTLGVSLLGVASLWTQVPSRAVGFFLLLFVVPWVVLLSVGADPPTGLEFATTAMMAVAVVAIGVSLRAEGGPPDRAEPASTGVRHD